MAKPQALEWLLSEAGMDVGKAKHVCKVLDRLRLCSMASDDFAGLLFSWRQKAVERAFEIGEGHRNAAPALPDCPTLFDY